MGKNNFSHLIPGIFLNKCACLYGVGDTWIKQPKRNKYTSSVQQ